MRTSAAILGLLVVAACGDAVKPPEAPVAVDAPPPADTAPAAKKGALDGPTAPASSDDVKKGIASLKAGDMNAAKASFEAAIQKNPKQADAYHYLALVDDQTGQRAEAEKNYRKALELQPDLEESATNLAAILVEGGKNDEAAALMRKAIAKNPKNAALHVNLAMALSGKNDEAGANKAFDEALKLDPNNAIYLVTYAAHLAKSGKKDDAAAKLKLAERSSDPGVLASVALEYKGLRDFKSCASVLDKAVAQKDVAELRVYRGVCKLGLKDLPGATADFKEAVAKEPNNALAHYSLGNALGDSGKLADAVTEWEAYLRLAPDGPQAKAAEKKIALVKNKKK